MPQAVVLRTHADVDRATTGGLYAVHSRSAAYFPAMALIETGTASLAGEAYDEHGKTVAMAVPFASPGPRRLVQEGEQEIHGTIVIGQDYLVNALKAYADWRIAWWREAVQNSVDAGATLVALGATENPDGTYTVFCDDDGSGMDKDTILTKFLALGGTTKIGAGVAGGFGKAKEMLLLPWISWSIASRDNLVTGVGIPWTATKIAPRKGTRLSVVMPADRKTDSAMALAFLQRCNLPGVHFTVNSESARARLSGGNLVVSIPGKVDLFYKKAKEKQPDLYVRSKGLFMFSRYIGDVPGFLIAELTAPSYDILTDNRDGFRDRQVQGEIDRYAERIAKDVMTALRGKQGLIRQKFLGTGKFKARQRAAELMERIGPTHEGAGGKIDLGEADTDAMVQAIEQMRARSGTAEEQLGQLPPPEVAKAMLDQRFVGADQLQAAIKQLVWEPDFYVINDIEGLHVPRKFFPATMTPMVLKLAKSWTELCRYVLMQLGSETRYGVGFIFSEEMAAAALSEESEDGERERWLVLNPYKDLYRRKEIWHPAQDQDLKWLYSAAIHEATHIADGISYHDESFAAALTRNFARCADGFRKIRAIVGGIRMRGGIEADVDDVAEG